MHEGWKTEEQIRADSLSKRVIGAAIEVHRTLGPGLLESCYESCLCRELQLRQIPFERQVPLKLDYKGIHVDCAYRIDILVDNILILELKSVDKVEPVYKTQLLTYLRLSDLWLGLLLNFNEEVLKDGIYRVVN